LDIKVKKYSNGIYDDTVFSSIELNHSVVIVVYALDVEINFWIVKDSWKSLLEQKCNI
jgi:hypothetical protein